jgi:hypothetical protein
MKWNDRIQHLEEAHRVLDLKISAILKHYTWKQEEIVELKKKKLNLLDQIAQLKREHDLV